MVQIEIRSGPEAGRVVALGTGKHVVGRQKDCDLTVADATVSGKHAEIQVADDGTVRFRDLGSTNGTWSGGVQVEDGEWFAGSEIKLGSIVLRHVDEDLAASGLGEDDAEVHRRARAAAMEGGGRGGLWLVLVVLVLAAGGGAAWWFLFREEPAPAAGDGAVAGGGTSASGEPRARDAIEGLGDFSTPEDWVLGEGLGMADASLTASASPARARATLSPEFPLVDGALTIDAEVEGAHVVPLVSFGGDGDDEPDATWVGPALGGGAVHLALPGDAEWFRLALRVEGAGAVRALTVEAGAGAAERVAAPFAAAWHHGGNLWLADDGDTLLQARAGAGSWTASQGGLQYRAPEDGASVAIAVSPALHQDGPLLVLADGGPVGLAAGGTVEDSPGWMAGGGARRLFATLAPASQVRGTDGGVEVRVVGDMTVLWELTGVLTDAARLAGEIRSARVAHDDRAVLEAASRLLRDYPLEQEDVTLALTARQQAIERGRERLTDLEIAAGGALFVSALETMEDLEARANGLASTFPGTAIERDARDLAAVLRQAADGLRAERERKRAAYRERLDAALAREYPAIAAWLEQEGD